MVVPKRLSASSHPITAPGTETERIPVPGTVLSPFSEKKAGVARLPARPDPLSATTFPVFAMRMRRKLSPPTPFMCGRTTARTPAIAIAASTALPPCRSTLAPVAVARAWSEVTAPAVPITSGRRDGCWAASGAASVRQAVRIACTLRASARRRRRARARRGEGRMEGVMTENLPREGVGAIRTAPER